MAEQQGRGSNLGVGVRYAESISRAVQVNSEDEISISGGYCNDPKIITIISKWISGFVKIIKD